VVYTRILKKGDLLVTLGYSGTQYRSNYPGPDLQSASEDVAVYVSMLHARNSGARIVVIGESLGGVVATRAASLLPPHVISELILRSPLLYFPVEAINNRINVHHFRDADDIGGTVRISTGPATTFDSGHLETFKTMPLFQHFFAADEYNIDLLTRLTKACDQPVLLVYGDKDDIIGIEKVRDFKSLSCISLSAIAGMSHNSYTMQGLRVSSLIEEFVGETGRQI